MPHSLILNQVNTRLNPRRETPGIKSDWSNYKCGLFWQNHKAKQFTVVLKMQIHLLAVPQQTWNHLDFEFIS